MYINKSQKQGALNRFGRSVGNESGTNLSLHCQTYANFLKSEGFLMYIL